MAAAWCCDPSTKSSEQVRAVGLLLGERLFLQLLCGGHFDAGFNQYALVEDYVSFLKELLKAKHLEEETTLFEELEALKSRAKSLLFCAAQGTREDLLSRVIFLDNDTDYATTDSSDSLNILERTVSTAAEETPPPQGWTLLPQDVQSAITGYTTVGAVLSFMGAQSLLLRNVEVFNRDLTLGDVSLSSIYYR